VTPTFTGRLVFVGEVVIVAVILPVRRRMRPAPPPERRPTLDVVGAVLSASGLALIVFAILQSSSWGWVVPIDPPTIGGVEITPLGFSVVPFLILGGLGLLAAFASWEERQERLGRDALLDLALTRIVHLRAGASTLVMQQIIIMGTFFVLPVYLQVVLGLDAFETGKKLVPMSVMMLLAALAGPRAAARRSPKRVAQIGLVSLAIGSGILLATIDVELDSVEFAIALGLFGIGAGLLASQLGNVIMSSVDPSKTNEAGGLQGTAQNLGSSLGTALIGAVLMTGMTGAFVGSVEQNPAVPPDVAAQIATVATEGGLEVVPVAQVESELVAAGLPADQASAVASDYGAAQLEGLRRAMGAVAVFALLALWFTRRLPGSAAMAGEPSEASMAPPTERAATA